MANQYTSKMIPEADLIEALIKHNGVIAYAAEELGIIRQRLSDRVCRSEKLRAIVEAAKEGKPITVTEGKEPETEEEKKEVKEQLPLALAKPDSTLKIERKPKEVFVISCAQNNTELHQGFLKNLLNLVKENNAQFIVRPVRYKNVTLYTTKKEEYEISWPKELESYYLNHEFRVNENLVILGDLSINATAASPLEGIGQVVSNRSAIVGHAALEVKMLANAQDQISRMLTTTGSLSLKNYSATKAGYKAEQNHVIGALIVEVDNDKFFIRQIEAEEDGSFYDLDYRYERGTITRGHRAAALSCGDIHGDFVDPDVVKATWLAENSIVNTVRPMHQFIHDALDFYSANHHHKKDFFLKHAKNQNNTNIVEDEINRLIDLHNKLWIEPNTIYHYIGANHNDALTRWLNEADPKADLDNALLYHKLCVFMLENTKTIDGTVEVPNPLEYMMKSKIKNPHNTIFHGRNSTIVVSKSDHGQHGDRGLNGAKGSLNSFAKLGLHMVLEHSHTPGRKGRVIQGGTSSKTNLGYNSGYSSWLPCHVLEYPNGAVTLLPIIKGQWRATCV